MNCPACMGRLWLEDYNGDFFRCLACNGTGNMTEREKHGSAVVLDFDAARRLRDSKNTPPMVPHHPDGDAA